MEVGSTATEIQEPEQDKTHKMTCVACKDSDQPGHLPKTDPQADLRLHWVHKSVCFCSAATQFSIFLHRDV